MANETASEAGAILRNFARMREWMAKIGNSAAGADVDHDLLAGGTTGQVLEKASNADYDTVWANPGTTSPLTTKGDLYTYSSTNARLPVGTNGQIVQANSAATTGNQWSTVSGDATLATGGALTLANTAVTPGSYTNTNLTVDSKGRLTAAASGGPTEAVATASPTTTYTADFSVAQIFKLTLGGNTAITLSGATNGVGCGYTFYLIQDGTGSRIPTFTPTLKWPGGVAPTLSTVAGSIDIIIVETTDGATTAYANLAGKAYA